MSIWDHVGNLLPHLDECARVSWGMLETRCLTWMGVHNFFGVMFENCYLTWMRVREFVVVGSGTCPAWMAKVANLLLDGAVILFSVQ